MIDHTGPGQVKELTGKPSRSSRAARCASGAPSRSRWPHAGCDVAIGYRRSAGEARAHGAASCERAACARSPSAADLAEPAAARRLVERTVRGARRGSTSS